MNHFKQSKSSIIFQECWVNNGATTEQISDALTEAGYEMPEKDRLLPMLKTYQRKGLLEPKDGLWFVNENPEPKPMKGKRK